jgi:hypothetical protein
MPRRNTAERWKLANGSGGWVHPIHVHFEECRVLTRNGVLPPVYERGRKDVVHLGTGESAEIFLQFSDFPAGESAYLIERAALIKKKFKAYEKPQPMADRTLAMIFEKASTRTRSASRCVLHLMVGRVGQCAHQWRMPTAQVAWWWASGAGQASAAECGVNSYRGSAGSCACSKHAHRALGGARDATVCGARRQHGCDWQGARCSSSSTVLRRAFTAQHAASLQMGTVAVR